MRVANRREEIRNGNWKEFFEFIFEEKEKIIFKFFKIEKCK